MYFFILVCVVQYAVESQIRLRGFDPSDSMVLLKPRAVTLYYFLDTYLLCRIIYSKKKKKKGLDVVSIYIYTVYTIYTVLH